MTRKISVKSIVGALFLAIALWVYATLNTRMTTLVDFPVSIVLPSDRAADGALPEAVHVKIRASGWELLNLRYVSAGTQCLLDYTSKPFVTATFPVSKNDILQSLHPAISLDKVIEIFPETFKISTSAIAEKRVAVNPKLQISLRSGFTLVGEIAVRPDSITIRGNAGLLQNIGEWKTESKKFSDVNRPFIIYLQLQDSLTNKVSFTQRPITISGDVQLTAEQIVYDVPVEIYNAPLNASHHILPQQFTVTVRGGIDKIQNLSPELFKMRIDYSALKSDTTGLIIPTPSSPENVEIIRIEPRILYHTQKTTAQESTPNIQTKGL